MYDILSFFSFFSLFMILILQSFTNSYAQSVEAPENIPDLRITEFQVSDKTIPVDGTITLSGSVENVGEYPARNTLISVYSTYRPTMNITGRIPEQLVEIAPHSNIKFMFAVSPYKQENMELAIMALPENGKPVKSALVQITVIEQAEKQKANDIYFVPSIMAASLVGVGVLLYGYKRRGRKTP